MSDFTTFVYSAPKAWNGTGLTGKLKGGKLYRHLLSFGKNPRKEDIFRTGPEVKARNEIITDRTRRTE